MDDVKPIREIDYYIYEQTSNDGGRSWWAEMWPCDKKDGIYLGGFSLPIPRGEEQTTWGIGMVLTISISAPVAKHVEAFYRSEYDLS